MGLKLFVTTALALASLGAAPAPKAPPAPAAPRPYLSAEDLDTYKVLPAAPVAGTTRYEADRTVFLQLRRLEGSPRWELAKADDVSSGIIRNMACAIGADLTVQNAPLTYRMLSRVGRDSSRVTNGPKDIYQRKRPYLIDEGNICIAKSESLAKSPDYPSGHNTFGWSIGLIMAEVAPDRATPILARARAFGESRLVCGVHNMSAAHMGWVNASMLVAALHGKAEFRKDLDAVRAEVAAIRKTATPPDAARCAAEAELIAQPLY
jgi:acid phosphatase (class A)